MKTYDFKTFAFTKDYHVDGKYIGSEVIEGRDRHEKLGVGYYSRVDSIAEEDIRLKKKVIKKGTKYYTFLYPLNGRMLR